MYLVAMTFQSEYLNEFFDSDEDQALRAFAREYHEDTETYDQVVCSGRDWNGVAIPIGHESALCNANAKRVRAAIITRERLDPVLLDKAIGDYAHVFEQDWRAGLYNHLKRQPTHA